MRNAIASVGVLVGLLASVGYGQVPAGGEFRVNTYTTGSQGPASVSSAPNGEFAVAWESYQDGDGRGVFLQRFDAASTSLGSEVQVNSYSTGPQRGISVASDERGNYVVVWLSGSGPSGEGIRAQRFSASGDRRGGEFRVDTDLGRSVYWPALASDAAGNFLVVWWNSARGVRGRCYDASGAANSAEIQVSGVSSFRAPAVAASAAGGFAVAWEAPEGSDSGIRARRFDAACASRGDEFQVNSYTTDFQYGPAVTSDAAGNFVVAWSSHGQEGPFSYADVYARRYDSSGSPAGGEFRVNSNTEHYESTPQLASDAAGNFTVTWFDSGTLPGGGGGSLWARRYDSSGAPRGGEFRPTLAAVGGGGRALALDAAGNLVMAWTRASDVYAQRFGGVVPAALRVDPAPSGASDGNDVLEQNEAVAVWPAWRNVNGMPMGFDGEGLSFSGPMSDVVYTLIDAAATYGIVLNGQLTQCSDCYAVGVSSGVRPAVHWDTTFTERLTPDVLGLTKLWSLHVGESFVDVPRTSGYYRFVETLLHKGVTGGCEADSYCPVEAVTREQLAVFVLTGKEGAGYLPQACGTPVFADVPATSPFCRFVEDLSRRGVVSGCGGGNYCPTSPVTREQMPVFVLKTLEPSLDPPACGTPVFADVPATSPYCKFIEELARRGVVGGCGGGNYCPSDAVTREQMAVFISATFGLTLYGP